MSALATVEGRVLIKGKFTAKICFRAFYVSIADADIGSLLSLYTLFDNCLDHMLVKFDQNRMVRNIQNFVLFGLKWLQIFDKVLTLFWNNSLMLEY